MDKEDFVTYEQALALKKLGFREETFKYYFGNDQLQPSDNPSIFGVHIEAFCDFNAEEGHVKGGISAPTLAQAQKWLREVKNIIVLSTCNLDYKNRHSWYWFIDVNIEVEEPEYSYKTYEEALSAGITECLKFLNNDTDSNK